MPACTRYLIAILCMAECLFAESALATQKDRYSETEALIELIKQNDAAFTPALRTLFLQQAEADMIRELKSVGVTLNQAQLDFVRQDPMIYDACYGTVYPADPRILLNILELRKQVGEKMFDTYKNLLVAGAVARRYIGVNKPMGEKEEWIQRSRADAEAKSKKRVWPNYSVVTIKGDQITRENDSADVMGEETEDSDEPAIEATKNKKTPPARIVQKRKAKWEKSQSRFTDPEGIDIIYRFLQEKKITPRQLSEADDLKKELLSKMGKHAPEAGVISYQLLERVMTAKGLRPAERDPFPSMADWCRYLDGIKPNFPIKSAPWPMMLPLAKGWPLREAQQIWANYEKSGKLLTYGKYQGKEKVIQLHLEPFPWHWQSWQGTYQAGGVCHEMSTIGLGSFMCVGVPTCKTGQPHHSCIITFNYKNGAYSVTTKQGTKGPEQTHSQWLFADPKVELPEIYHIGLALSMNQGLAPYMDSRMGLHMAKILIARNEYALAKKMLESVLHRNPYNTEVWHELIALHDNAPRVLHQAKLIQLLTSLVASSEDEVIDYTEKAVDVSLEHETDSEDVVADNPKINSSNFVRVLGKMFLLPGLQPVADKEINRKALELLKGCGKSGLSLSELLPKFEVAVNGWEAMKAPITEGVQHYITNYAGKSGKETNKAQAEHLSNRIRAAADAAEGNSVIEWLKELEKTASAKMVNRNRPKSDKVYLDTVYKAVVDSLSDKLTKAGQEAEAKRYTDKLNAALATAKKK